MIERANNHPEDPMMWERLIALAQQGVRLTTTGKGGWRFSWLAVSAPSLDLVEQVGMAATEVHAYSDALNEAIDKRLSQPPPPVA